MLNATGEQTSVVRNQWGVSREKMVIDWKHPLGTIRTDVRRFTIGGIIQKSPSTWAPIILGQDKPDSIELDFAHEVRGDVFVLCIRENAIIEDVTRGGIPSVEMPIEWDNGIPHTPQKEKGHFDLILLKTDGTFIQIEPSVATRNGRFWVCKQAIFGGVFVKDAMGHIIVVPSNAENNYPGVDYLNSKMCRDAAPELLKFAAEHCKLADIHTVKVPRWEPNWSKPLSDQMKKNGWVRAAVLFFNVVNGWGIVLCEDGRSCFVHFKDIMDEYGKPIFSQGEFPILQPMSGVAIKYKEEGNKRKATAVRIV
jgi:hypothetical protein